MTNGMTYRSAGVDIDAGNRLVGLIRNLVKPTYRPEVLDEVGGFGGQFRLDVSKYKEPVLVAGADGVGTKLRVAMEMGVHHTVGIDLVAMCVNDVLAQGAEPLFFLDYLAVGKLVPEQAAEIIKGVAEGCRQAGCALLGGETAEMPDMYGPSDYDLAGFAVGVAERSRIIDGSAIEAGDAILGLASNGLHSNGYSLARKVLLGPVEDKPALGLGDPIAELGCTLGEELLKPTRIYVPLVLPLLEKYEIHGLAHITGGGLVDNIGRILPPGLVAAIRSNSWPVPPIFKLIQERGQVIEAEMRRVFNLGLGYVIVAPPPAAEAMAAELSRQGERCWLVGEVKDQPHPAAGGSQNGKHDWPNKVVFV